MTLRGVIEGLFRGSDDAEAMLAENGYADLPADMFSQALSSYADTAPMAEADALTPVLASLEAGDPGDVFAVLAERPLGTAPENTGAEVATIGASLAGVEAVEEAIDDTVDDAIDEAVDDFGVSVDAEPTEVDGLEDVGDGVGTDVEVDFSVETEIDADDPFATDALDSTEDTSSVESFEDLFDTEPQATGDDPADLDLDF